MAQTEHKAAIPVKPKASVLREPSAKGAPGADRSDLGARAAPRSQDTAAASAKEIGETIIVTATRRRETLQHTPAAITAFTDERRNLIGVETGQDIINLTPSASLQGQFVALRGVGRFETPGQGTDPGIAVNVDGVFTGSPSYLSFPDFLTDRVEILRGPQAINGHNSLGGEVDIFSRRPTNDLHEDFRIGGNSIGETYVQAALSGPIADNLKYRVAEAYDAVQIGAQGNRGSKRRPGTGNDNLAEAQLEWAPADDLNIWVRYQNYEQHMLGFYGVAGGGTDFGLASRYLSSGLVSNAYFGLAPNPQYGLPGNSNPSLGNPFKTNVNDLGHEDLGDDHTATINASYDLHGATLKYVGGYSQYTNTQSLDTDFNARQYLTTAAGRQVPASFSSSSPQTKHFYSNELSLSSQGADRLRWTVGLYDYGENYQTGFQVDDPLASYLAQPVSSLATLAPAAPNPSRAFYSQTTSLQTNSEAVYGQADYDVTDTIRATLAFRCNWDQREGSNSFREVFDYYGLFGDAPGTPKVALDVTPAQPGGEARGSFENKTGKAGLEWHPDRSVIAYTSVARGYQPGGFDLGAFSKIPSVDSETLTDYELGVKKSFGTTFLIDASGFYYQYNNLQVPITVGIPNPRAAGDLYLITLIDAQRARSFGTELESVWSPTSDLHLTFLYSYLNAAFDEFRNPVPAGVLRDTASGATYKDLRGNPVPQSPKNKFSFSPQYVLHFGVGDLSLAAIYSYTGSQYDGIFKTAAYRAPQYENLSVRALFQPKRTHWTVILYARNVTNSVQYIYRSPSVVYPQQTAYTVNPPLIVGAELQYHF